MASPAWTPDRTIASLLQFLDTGGRLEFIAGAIIDDDQIAADLDDRDVRLRLRAVGGPAKTLGDFRELFRRRFGATTLSGMVNDPSLTTVTSASPE